MQPVLDKAIRQEVAHRVRKGEAFSAYDVTVAVRGGVVQLDHNECKAIVHQMFDDGEMDGYDRSLRDYGGNEPAWEYRPIGVSSVPADVQPSSIRSYVSSSTPGDGEWCVAVDQRGTLCIPNVAVRALKYQAADEVDVWIDASEKKLIISRAYHPLPVRVYTVDKSDNIRITTATLRAANLTGRTFGVVLDGGTIVVLEEG